MNNEEGTCNHFFKHTMHLTRNTGWHNITEDESIFHSYTSHPLLLDYIYTHLRTTTHC